MGWWESATRRGYRRNCPKEIPSMQVLRFHSYIIQAPFGTAFLEKPSPPSYFIYKKKTKYIFQIKYMLVLHSNLLYYAPYASV